MTRPPETEFERGTAQFGIFILEVVLSRARCEATFQALSQQGYRVLAVAYRAVAAKPAYLRDDEADLTLAGLLAFVDPQPRRGVALPYRLVRRVAGHADAGDLRAPHEGQRLRERERARSEARASSREARKEAGEDEETRELTDRGRVCEDKGLNR